MKTTTKLLGLGLAGAGLLLTACEVPGGGPPTGTVVIANPGDAATPFRGFPARFQGTNIILPQGNQPNAEAVIGYSDLFETTVEDETDLVITCDTYDEWTYVYVSSDAGSESGLCSAAPIYVTVQGATTVEIGYDSSEPGAHPYDVLADIDEGGELG